jgi:hypothetical protein
MRLAIAVTTFQQLLLTVYCQTFCLQAHSEPDYELKVQPESSREDSVFKSGLRVQDQAQTVSLHLSFKASNTL